MIHHKQHYNSNQRYVRVSPLEKYIIHIQFVTYMGKNRRPAGKT